MAKPTMRAQLVSGLTHLGYKVMPNTAKYEVFQHPQGKFLLYVGKQGALRIRRPGRTLAESIPVSPKFRDAVLQGARL